MQSRSRTPLFCYMSILVYDILHWVAIIALETIYAKYTFIGFPIIIYKMK